MTLNADIEASAAGTTRQFTGGMITGSAIVLAAADFGAGSGDAFVDAALTLPRGIYWIVVYNDSGTGSPGGDWFWESGGADAGDRSLETITANNTIPPHPRWSPNPDFQLALSIGAGAAEPPGQPVGVPAMGPAGLALLMFLAMLGAWLMAWRRRPE